jgi:hypothetical protein
VPEDHEQDTEEKIVVTTRRVKVASVHETLGASGEETASEQNSS